MSAFLEILLQPIPISLILLIIGYLGVLSGRKKLLHVVLVGILVLAISSTPAVGRFLVRQLESQYPALNVSDIPMDSVALVLSGAIDMPVSPRERFELTHAADRLMYTHYLFQQGKLSSIVVTGRSSYPNEPVQTESEYSVKLLAQMGVPVNLLIEEARSSNTFENVHFSERLLRESVQKDLLVVTSAAHMPRAMAVVNNSSLKDKFNITAVPTDFRVALSTGSQFHDYVPSSPGLNLTTMALHEYLGFVYYKLRGYIL